MCLFAAGRTSEKYKRNLGKKGEESEKKRDQECLLAVGCLFAMNRTLDKYKDFLRIYVVINKRNDLLILCPSSTFQKYICIEHFYEINVIIHVRPKTQFILFMSYRLCKDAYYCITLIKALTLNTYLFYSISTSNDKDQKKANLTYITYFINHVPLLVGLFNPLCLHKSLP